MSKRDERQKKGNKLSYYNIGMHRAALIVYALITLVFSVVVSVLLMRFFFWALTKFTILGVGEGGGDYSYLTNYLGGLIGIVVGFFADAIFISRLQHLKRYNSFVSLLNKELNDVKNTICDIWGLKEVVDDKDILQFLKEVGLVDENNAVALPSVIRDFGDLITSYDKDDPEQKRLTEAIKKAFSKPDVVKTLRNKTRMQGYDGKLGIYDVRDYFVSDGDVVLDGDETEAALAYLLALCSDRITKINAPVLENIVSSPEGIATFFNLPRYTYWSEEQGNFARELQYFYHTITSFGDTFDSKSSWQFTLICKDLVDRIDKMLKITDRAYYQSDVCRFLYEPFKDVIHSDNPEFIAALNGLEHKGVIVRSFRLKKTSRLGEFAADLVPFLFRSTASSNYIRYKVVFRAKEKSFEGERMEGRAYVMTEDRKVMPRKFVLKFEKGRYGSDNVKDMLYDFDRVFDTRNVISLTAVKGGGAEEQNSAPDLRFSFKYLSSGIKRDISKVLGVTVDEDNVATLDEEKDKVSRELLEPRMRRLSSIFADITTVPVLKNSSVRVKKGGVKDYLTIFEDAFCDSLYKIVTESYFGSDGENGAFSLNACESETVISITGPAGSFKNKPLQYIFIKLKLFDLKDVPVFYINFGKYEDELNLSKMTDDLEEIVDIINDMKAKGGSALESEQGKTVCPLFILDNIRCFPCGVETIYDTVQAFLKKKIISYKLILNCDTLDLMRSYRNRPVPFALNEPFSSEKAKVRISSMNINRERESVDFIANCLAAIAEEDMPERPVAEGKLLGEAAKIRDKLIKLDFYTLDAYCLTRILTKTDELTSDSDNILELYEHTFLKRDPAIGKHKYDKLAQSIYEFEYEGRHFDQTELIENEWKLAREHRSIIDYFLARHYVSVLRETVLPDSAYSVVKNIGGKLNLFLPKSINRFIIHALTDNDVYNLVCFCEENRKVIKKYKKFECQISYILSVMGGFCRERVKTILKDMLADDVKIPFATAAEIRLSLFLRRCAAVGLGRLGDDAAYYEYLETIIPSDKEGEDTKYDKDADNLNRAFHLDYYGDLKLATLLNDTFANYNDQTDKGINTIRRLGAEIKHKKSVYARNGENNNILILQMLTFLSIMKARKYKYHVFNTDKEFAESIVAFLGILAENAENEALERALNAAHAYYKKELEQGR